MNVTTIGIDLAKSVFQFHGIDAAGEVIFRKKLRRSAVLDFLRDLPPCLIGLEACATGHFWAREISALGHEARLIPPSYVKPYVKRQKNDAADAEAICEAVTRSNMRFVPIKSAERQGVLMLHRSRDLLMRQRTMTLNAVRAHLAEFGIITAQGPHKILALIRAIQAGEVPGLPQIAAAAVESLATQLDNLAGEIRRLERRLWPGTVQTRLVSVSRPSPAWASSPQQLWPLACPTPPSSGAGDSSRLSSAWCHARTRLAAKTVSAGYPRWAMVICAGFLSSAPPRWFGAPAATHRRQGSGCEACLSASPREWLPWLSPTKPPVSPGPCSHVARPIGRRRQHKRHQSQGRRRISSPRHAVRANVSDDDQRGRYQENPRWCRGFKAR